MNSAPASQSQINTLDWTGKKLSSGRYEVATRLGGGSMGFVYVAIDANLDSTVVIKSPTVSRMQNEGFLRRFQQESKFLVKLRHPHIISILDVGTEAGIPYFVMQFVGGGSLEDKQRRQGKRLPMSRKSLNQWLPQIASALDFMHAQGYVHRDVKPGNILFDDHANPYLSDFGLSKVLATETETDSGQTVAGAVVGTPNYVAPELVLGREFDGQVDQYSLAITVFEILTGKVPFEGPSASATMVNQVSQRAPNPAEVNPRIGAALSQVILRGMSKKSSNRFDSCGDFAAAVLAAADQDAGSSAANTSSESWLSSGATQFADAPQFTSHGKTKVVKNRATCVGCKTSLVVKKEYAGKKGKCNQCGMRMSISKNLKTVEFYVPFDANAKPSKSADDEFSLVFSQKAFGMEFDHTTALAIVFTLLAAIILSGGIAFVLYQNAPSEEDIRDQQTKKVQSEQRTD